MSDPATAGMDPICGDLAAEHAALDALVAELDEDGWDTVTPAEGWAIRDEVSHLAYFDEAALLAATDPDAFARAVESLGEDPGQAERDHLERGRSSSGAELLQWWRQARTRLLDELRTRDPKDRLPWYGPPMSAMSFATARLMETWAHGQDIFDAVGREREPTGRLRHVCHIGVRALPYAYMVRGREVPTTPIRVELEAPDGGTWSWGEPDAADRVTGSALDFALLATQRRHVDDTDVRAEGGTAREWLTLIQAFAGPPGPGRAPLAGDRSSPGAAAG